MKAVIPVAGIGTRLRPLTNNFPKVLLNVAGRPMLSHLIDELIVSKELDTIIIVVGYLGGMIKEYIEKTYRRSTSVKFEFAEQKEMLGLGHAVYQSREFINDEPLLIVLGDTIFEFNLESVLASEHSVIGTKEVEDITRFGIVESSHGFIVKMIEKPSGPEVTKSKNAIAGVYFLKNPRWMFQSIEHIMRNNIRTKNEFQLTDALQHMVDSGERFVEYEIRNWFDCGKPETLLSTNGYLLGRNQGSTPIKEFKGSTINPPVFIADDCVIENSIIGPYTTLCSVSKVVNSSVINSIICDGAEVSEADLNEVVLGYNEKVSGSKKRIIKADSSEIQF